MAFYPTVVSSKGRVAIPTELRKKLGLKKGTRATWSEEDGRLVLAPITERRLDQIMGFSKRAAGQALSRSRRLLKKGNANVGENPRQRRVPAGTCSANACRLFEGRLVFPKKCDACPGETLRQRGRPPGGRGDPAGPKAPAGAPKNPARTAPRTPPAGRRPPDEKRGPPEKRPHPATAFTHSPLPDFPAAKSTASP